MHTFITTVALTFAFALTQTTVCFVPRFVSDGWRHYQRCVTIRKTFGQSDIQFSTNAVLTGLARDSERRVFMVSHVRGKMVVSGFID